MDLPRRQFFQAAATLAAPFLLNSDAFGDNALLTLNLRSRVKNQRTISVVEKPVAWPAEKTAIIVCDMWDDHWCKSAARRVAELAGPMNQVLRKARSRGVFIIHSPSTVTSYYKDTPQRLRARQAPASPTPVPLATAQRWGTAWCWPNANHEAVLPIDDSDMGCDCQVKCTIRDAWTRQIATLEIDEADAISDDGQEVWNLLTSHGIDNVILCGVHLNMCVLGRPFGIRQMTGLGKKVAMIRDMTDTMYNPQRPPGVSHFEGTNLVIKHVETYWCPSFVSTDITGSPSFHFRDDPGPAGGN
jgi:nicotinamidase-related amidase